MTEFTASNGLRVATDTAGGVSVAWSAPRDQGWSCLSEDETQALREFFQSERDAAADAEVAAAVERGDPSTPHRYRGNASGLTCWVGQSHDLGMCGKRAEDPIHDPFGESWGFTAGGWEFYFVAPDDVRCTEVEGGGVQCIHLAGTDHAHEVDPRLLRGLAKVVARRRGAGPIEVAS